MAQYHALKAKMMWQKLLPMKRKTMKMTFTNHPKMKRFKRTLLTIYLMKLSLIKKKKWGSLNLISIPYMRKI